MLGKGAYAKVYKFEGEGLAIKHYVVGHGTGLSPCFREIELLHHLDHPNIVKVNHIYVGPWGSDVKSNKVDGQLHIIMEQGRSNLHGAMKEELSTDEKTRILRDILLGLEFMHKNGIIHRDLNDGNVLVMDDGRATICDFGMSKHYLSELEINDEYVHSHVRSPEMHSESSYDFGCDIWSFGVLMVQLLLGKNPFAMANVLLAIIDHVPVCPSEDELLTWVAKCKKRSTSYKEDEYREAVKLRIDGKRSAIDDIQDEQAKDLIGHCLKFQRKYRWTASQLLEHPWFKDHKEYIKEHREKHLVVRIPDPNINDEVLLPTSSLREEIRDYLRKEGDKIAKQIDRRTSRICLSLNFFYRIMQNVDLKSFCEEGPFVLFLVCLIVVQKYCCTNSTVLVRELIPSAYKKFLDHARLCELEENVLRASNHLFYKLTTYDVLLKTGRRVTKDSAEQVWMRYLGGRTRRVNVEEEYADYLKTLEEND